MFDKIDHIGIAVKDMDAALALYEKMGAKQVGKRDRGNGRISVNLDLNGTMILVSNPADDSEQPGLGHFAIRTNNIEESVAELKSRGVEFTQEIIEPMPGIKISFFTGPDNVSVELLESSG